MSFRSLTTRTPDGITNATEQQTMGNSGVPDPTWSHIYADDFDDYTASDFTITTVQAVTPPTEALTPFNGGALLVTTNTGASDAAYFQKPVAGFQLTAGKAAFLKFAGQLSDVVNSVFYFGLLETTTTPLAPTDGIYISKANGAGTLTLNSMVGSALTSVAIPGTEVLVNGTSFELGIEVDVLGNVAAYFNPTTGRNVRNVSGGRVAVLATPGLTTALLNPSFGMENTTAASRSLTIDYIVASVER